MLQEVAHKYLSLEDKLAAQEQLDEAVVMPENCLCPGSLIAGAPLLEQPFDSLMAAALCRRCNGGFADGAWRVQSHEELQDAQVARKGHIGGQIVCEELERLGMQLPQ